jgi:putative two-component system response regulator
VKSRPIRRAVLLVDPDPDSAGALAAALDAAGYDCAPADVAAARARLLTGPEVDVLVCDASAPPGAALVERVAADLPHVAVVVLAGDDPGTAALARDSGAYGYLVTPVTAGEVVFCVTAALARRDAEARAGRHIEESTVDRLGRLAGAVGAIDVAGTADDEMIGRLSRAVSLRDEETGAHIERMSRYAAHLAVVVGFADLSPDEVRLAAALHDVGKIGIADTILLKPGPLTAAEHATMQRHARLGYQLLAGASSALVRRAADIAYAHHEWWDGGGYPRGLRGDEIPEAARIAAVADVFDALTSDRVYRPAMPVGDALALMSGLRGRHFEPRLLDALLRAEDDLAAIRGDFPDTADEPRIRVLVVDDHEMFVESLVRLLGGSPDLKVVGRAATVAAAVSAAVSYEPDVVLMDFELPDGTGIDATRQIKALVPRVKVVMLTGRTDQLAYTQAVDAGCAGFVTKVQPAEALIDAVSLAHYDEATIPAAELAPVLGGLSRTHRGLASALGRREVEVLGLLAEGLSTKAIAQRLSLSVNTVRNQVQSILDKLHAHSKLEAVATGVREGIVDHTRAGTQ